MFSYRSGLSVLDVVSVWIWHLHSFTKEFLGNLSLFPLSKLDGGKKKRKGEFLSWIPLSLSSLTIVYTLPSLTQTLHLVCYIILSLSAFMCNVCCVMTSSSFYLCCWFHISEPSGRLVGGTRLRAISPVTFWDADHPLLQEWLSAVMRRQGVKNPLPSTSTQNMWEWENLILYLTSRCLSGFHVNHRRSWVHLSYRGKWGCPCSWRKSPF